MKILEEPTVELLKQESYDAKGILQFIERCARLSYKSENLMTDTSYTKFCDMLVDKDHGRPLEFGTVHLKMDTYEWEDFTHSLITLDKHNDIWMKHNCVSEDSEPVYYITMNYRYFTELCKTPCLANLYPACTPEDGEHFPKRYTAKFVISRGVMDEFRTHISLSSIAESTRWCNYSKGKFNNEITVILPRNLYDIPEDNVNYIAWKESLTDAENAYMDLLALGWTPQHARGVLPLDIKSELIMCGFEDAWNNFFYRRCALDAHPDARYIASKLKSKLDEEAKMDKSL